MVAGRDLGLQEDVEVEQRKVIDEYAIDFGSEGDRLTGLVELEDVLLCLEDRVRNTVAFGTCSQNAEVLGFREAAECSKDVRAKRLSSLLWNSSSCLVPVPRSSFYLDLLHIVSCSSPDCSLQFN
jgi:hypothetical protein